MTTLTVTSLVISSSLKLVQMVQGREKFPSASDALCAHLGKGTHALGEKVQS